MGFSENQVTNITGTSLARLANWSSHSVSLCNLSILCVSVGGWMRMEKSPPRQKEHEGCTEKKINQQLY